MLLSVVLLCLSGLALAEKAGLVSVGNKLCPVIGSAIPAEMMGKTIVEYNGKVYNLCCPGCKDKFLSEAEKYSKLADMEHVVPAKTEATVSADVKMTCPIK